MNRLSFDIWVDKKITTEEVDGLVLKLMTEKANAKFAKVFNKEQQKIVQLYLFSENNLDTQKELKVLLETIRKESEDKIKNTVNSPRELDKQTCDKLNSILSLIQENKNQCYIAVDGCYIESELYRRIK